MDTNLTLLCITFVVAAMHVCGSAMLRFYKRVIYFLFNFYLMCVK